MAKSSKSARQRSKPRVVLVFGETRDKQYDADAVSHLVRGLLDRDDIRVEPRREFLRLVKGNLDGAKPAVSDLKPLVKAAGVRSEVLAVVKHEDTDAVEPSHVDLASAIERMSADVGVPVHAAAAAWELEAWLLQWPDQIAAVRPSWRAPTQYEGKSVGKIANAKQALRDAVRPAGLKAAERKRFPDYKESDAVEIARRVRDANLTRSPRAQSDSYDRFVGRMDQLLEAAS